MHIYDLGDSQVSELEKNANFSPSGWSPSGKYLLLDGFREMAGQVWISNAVGKEKSKVFDIKDFLDRLPPNSIITEQPILLNSFWMTDTLIFIKNPYGTTFLFDIDKKEVRSVIDGEVKYISPNGNFWTEIKDPFGKTIDIVFLTGERITLPFHHYMPSPDGKKVLYSELQGENWRVFTANIDKIRGISDETEIISLPNTTSGFLWSPNGKYLLYVMGNSEGVDPPFYGWCIVISATDGQEVYNERCDYGGGFLAWSPDENSSEFGTLTTDKKFVLYNIKTKDNKALDIFSLNLPAESTRQLVDWQMIEVP